LFLFILSEMLYLIIVHKSRTKNTNIHVIIVYAIYIAIYVTIYIAIQVYVRFLLVQLYFELAFFILLSIMFLQLLLQFVFEMRIIHLITINPNLFIIGSDLVIMDSDLFIITITTKSSVIMIIIKPGMIIISFILELKTLFIGSFYFNGYRSSGLVMFGIWIDSVAKFLILRCFLCYLSYLVAYPWTHVVLFFWFFQIDLDFLTIVLLVLYTPKRFFHTFFDLVDNDLFILFNVFLELAIIAFIASFKQFDKISIIRLLDIDGLSHLIAILGPLKHKR